MAEIIGQRNRSDKRSTRVDLTPMVDLGFLLITFFIFTTSMSKPIGFKIFLPKAVAEEEKMTIPVSGALTIFIAGNNRIWWYEGSDTKNILKTNRNDLRSIILNKIKRTTTDKLVVIIKPGRDSDFESIVNAMDEMTIDGVKHYVMVDTDPDEYAL